MSYPLWAYYPRNARPPEWVAGVIDVVLGAEATISTVDRSTGLGSDAVLGQLRPGLVEQGFAVESGKRAVDKIRRPVLFGDGGVAEVSYEIDAFHDGLGIAVEVEAGRGAANNADYRDIVRTSLILDADYLVLLTPVSYRFQNTHIQAFRNTRAQLNAVYASDRLKLPFRGVLLVGY
ncbi:hypothetical protein ACQP1U_00135 [Actinomycetota bacterium]